MERKILNGLLFLFIILSYFNSCFCSNGGFSFTTSITTSSINVKDASAGSSYIQIPNTASGPSAGWIWYTALQDISQGFETLFNFQLSGQAPAGTGGSLLFAIQPVNDSQSGSGNAGTLGILDLVKTLGIGFKFNAQNNASMVVMFSSDLNISTSSYPTNLAWSDTNIHCFYLSYSVLTSPPILVGYMDLNYVFSYQHNLTSLFGTSQIYPGLIGSIEQQEYQNMTILAGVSPNSADIWDFTTFSLGDKVFISAPVLNFLDFTNMQSPVSSSDLSEVNYYVASSFPASYESSFNLPFAPGDVAFLEASSRNGLIGCTVELRDITTGLAINTNGLWKCTTTPPSFPSVLSSSYDDSSWSPATILDTNNPYSTSSLFMANIHVGLDRIWLQNYSLIFCRVVIPSFCSIYSTSNCNINEYCDFSLGLCLCNPPYINSNNGCVAIDTPNITSISFLNFPSLTDTTLYIPETGNLTIQINGTNFVSGTQCYLNGTAFPSQFISNSSIYCTFPPINGTNFYFLTVRLLPSGPDSSSFNVYYYPLFSITNYNPTTFQLTGGETIYIQGTNFSNYPYKCVIDGQVLDGVYSSGQVTCVTLPRGPGLFYLQLTINFADFVTAPNLILFQSTSVSKYCRTYKKVHRGAEFDFVSSGSLFSSNYFPQNLAFEQDVKGNYSLYNKSEIVNNDYCCKAQLGNDAYACGILYNPNTRANATVKLSGPAYVNEIVTSWANPCDMMPLFYNISYKDLTTGHFKFLQTRVTISNTSCEVFPGDSVPVGFCIDYLIESVISDTFEISFIHTSYSLLYEFAIQGIYTDAPYIFNVSSTWKSSNLNLHIANPLVLPPLQLNLETIVNTAPSNDAVNISISAECHGISQNLNVPSPVLYQPGIFDNLSITSPNYGACILSLSNYYMQNLSLNYNVLTGQGVAITVNPTSVSKIADSLVNLNNISVCVTDIFGNIVSSSNFTITFNLSLNIIGGNSFTITNGCFSLAVVLVKPLRGLYTMLFQGPNLSPASLSLEIQPGSPVQISYLGPTISNNRDNITAKVVITDAAGNPVSTASLPNAVITFTSIFPLPLESNVGVSAPVQNGGAFFPSIYFIGIYGSYYNLTFSINPLIFPPQVVDIYVTSCSVLYPGSTISGIGYECECLPGYGDTSSSSSILSCSACPVNYYKPLAGPGSCKLCPVGIEDTYGRVGQSSCVCDSNHMLDSTTSQCVPCPVGAICGDNNIIGNQQGYWESPQGNFYLCSESLLPNPDEISAANEACPALSSVCGTGYTGPICLTCSDSYGTFGPYCRQCPNPAISWVTVLICSILVLLLATFMIYQTQTESYKEAISVKILITHIQMLAIISVLSTWTEPFLGYLSIGAMALWIRNRLLYLDCLFSGTSFYSVFAGYMLFPIFAILLIVLIYTIIFLIVYRNSTTSTTRNNIIGNCLMTNFIVMFLIYPTISMKILEVFDCTVSIDGNSYLATAPSTQCGTSQHIGYAVWGALMLLIFSIGFPLASIILLYKFRTSTSPYWKLKFLYEGYKPNHYYWEGVVLFRKIAMVLCTVVFANDIVNAVYSLIYVVQGALLIHLLFHPHVSGRQHRLELVSITSILCTLFVSLYLIEQSNSPAVEGISIVLLIVHSFVILFFGFFIIRGLIRRYNSDFWQSISKVWKRKAPSHIKKNKAKLEKVNQFFQELVKSSDDQRAVLYARIDKWWKSTPNYKRRRLVSITRRIGDGATISLKSNN